MNGNHPRSTAKIGGHPIHPMLIPFPITCLVGAFVTDLLHLRTGDHGFAVASTWLLGFGIATTLVAATFGLIDYMGDDRIRRLGIALQHMLANVTAVVVAIINFVIRMDDPTDIRSLGVYLSGATVLILLYSGWLGGHMVYRHGVAVDEIADHHDRGESASAHRRA